METIVSLKGFDVIFISLGGILCIYLGYRLLIIGTNQPFKIFSDLKGWKFKAANITPGIFFAILGAVVLCSPVVTNIIAVLQTETFINTYATKLILDELRQKNEVILDYRLEKNMALMESGSKVSANAGNFFPTKLEESNKAVVISNVLRLRKEPGTHYQIIGSLRKGDIIRVKETRGLWLRVATDEFADGFVHGRYVKRFKGSRTTDSAESALLLSSNPQEHASAKR